MNFLDPRLPDRFWDKVQPCPMSGCWIWTGYRDRADYGRFQSAKSFGLAHRHAYKALVGPVPEGLELDHRCRVRSCCNPAHLEPVTHAENMRRSPVVGWCKRDKTHCPHGHEYAGKNLLFDANANNGKGARYCRACVNGQRRRRRAAARQGGVECPRT